ncbi:MAG: SPOR domain-containing protein [Bacteroidales bacterium]|nr:SPOR domain-containing protein [Bacteroidales bacterium]
MKKRIISVLVAVFAAVLQLCAQQADTTAARVDIFENLPATVSVDQPGTVREAFPEQVGKHPSENTHSSYRGGESVKGTFGIRIYSDNSQNARNISSQTLARFNALFPEEEASRTFSSPYFMVTVGHYSSRAEAEEALKSIRNAFPRAYIVRK